jgi:hypothetical protein
MFEPAKLQMNWASARGRISLRAAATGLAEIDTLLISARVVSNASTLCVHGEEGRNRPRPRPTPPSARKQDLHVQCPGETCIRPGIAVSYIPLAVLSIAVAAASRTHGRVDDSFIAAMYAAATSAWSRSLVFRLAPWVVGGLPNVPGNAQGASVSPRSCGKSPSPPRIDAWS